MYRNFRKPVILRYVFSFIFYVSTFLPLVFLIILRQFSTRHLLNKMAIVSIHKIRTTLHFNNNKVPFCRQSDNLVTSLHIYTCNNWLCVLSRWPVRHHQRQAYKISVEHQNLVLDTKYFPCLTVAYMVRVWNSSGVSTNFTSLNI